MDKEFWVKKTIVLPASRETVWESLTNPEITKKFYFGCEAVSDWHVESPVMFKTVHEGQETVHVKGSIVAIEKNRLLVQTCYATGNERDPSKHTVVVYQLEDEDGKTRLRFSQGPFLDEDTRAQHEASCGIVLNGLKAVLESS